LNKCSLGEHKRLLSQKRIVSIHIHSRLLFTIQQLGMAAVVSLFTCKEIIYIVAKTVIRVIESVENAHKN